MPALDYPWVVANNMYHDYVCIVHIIIVAYSSEAQDPAPDKVTQEYNVPWIIHGHPTSNVVATPVIRKCNVSMDYP